MKNGETYDSEVSNLNKYGSGQETWTQYESNSDANMTAYAAVYGTLVFLPVISIILFRKFGLHNKPAFDKIANAHSQASSYRAVGLIKKLLAGFFLGMMVVYMMYLCSITSHQVVVSSYTIC